jgi:hypothetical protein
MYVGYEIINDIDSDNIMGFYLTLDLPADLVPEGTVVVQQVRYRKQLAFGDWHTVACKTVVGAPDQAEVFNYRGQTAINGYDANGDMVTYDQAGAEDKITAADGYEFFLRREDSSSVYETEAFGEYTGNNLQNCLAQLPFPKVGVDPEFFGTYDAVFDARIYANTTVAEFTQIEPTTATQDFHPPVYTDGDLVDEIEEQSSIHAEGFIYEEFTFQMSDVDSTW